MATTLVIGYGNSLRSDDGIGVRIAEIVATWQLPQVRSRFIHQLTPELAAEIAEVDVVIFVDAGWTKELDAIELRQLKPLNISEFRTHFGDPATILTLTHALYGKCPQAWWLIVPGVNFQFGDRFSGVAETGISQALTQIRKLITHC
ncbi:MAG: hydrogenase maturation protease [Pleurocapsa sp.]